MQTGAALGISARAIEAALLVAAAILAVVVWLSLTGTSTLPINYPHEVPHGLTSGALTAFLGALFG